MATSKTKAAGPASKGLEVIALRESFFRGGQQFGREARIVPLADLTPEQAEQIRNESMLIVTEVDIAA